VWLHSAGKQEGQSLQKELAEMEKMYCEEKTKGKEGKCGP
jgi:hypothetical protein